MNTQSINVLFVEDSADDVEFAVRALKKDGIDLAWRRVDAEGDLRRSLAERAPDLVLSDFSMPGFDGLSALRLVRDLAPEVPFIFVSGTIGEERAIEAIRLGATDYVLKNNMRRLATAVKRALTEAEERDRIRRAEAERARLVEILEATSDYVGMSQPDGHQTYLNSAGRRLVGVREEEVPGKLIMDIYPPWAREIIEKQARPTAERDGLWQGETAMLGPNGAEIPVSQVIIAHRNADNSVRFFSTIARDISERKAYEAKLKYLANYDALTGLPNRALLGDRTSQAIGHARRTGRLCALITVTIDRFNLLNESYGHAAGDALLKLVAERLTGAVREGDTTARPGADTFAVLAADLARPDDILTVARKIQEAVKTPFQVDGREVHVSLSVGGSLYPRDGEEFDLLLRNADAAMSRVKADGGNAFQFYAAAMTREATDHIELETALRTAIAEKQLELHYQPQVALSDGRILAMEALMRWRHPQRGNVPPGVFIPIAESSDLIQSLGVWALMEASRQAAAWHAAGWRVRMAVNVSARQFRSDGFVDAVGRALRINQLDPALLELELTESVLIEEREKAIRILDRLKALGVQIAVDDFGTGYSSLSYLSGLPVDCLKIDRSFVIQTTKGGRDAAIAQAIISLAHALGLRVLAEGVETDEQRAFLSQHACDEAQGYLYARPATPVQLLPLLAAGRLPSAAASKGGA